MGFFTISELVLCNAAQGHWDMAIPHSGALFSNCITLWYGPMRHLSACEGLSPTQHPGGS